MEMMWKIYPLNCIIGLRYYHANEEILRKWLLIFEIKRLSESSKDQKHPSTDILNVGGWR